jgi:xanthine dehydrogenase YagS FAD-binding subunit
LPQPSAGSQSAATCYSAPAASIFPAEVDLACSKRHPGSGCAALDAVVRAAGPGGARQFPIGDLYRVPGDAPEHETVLGVGELITAIEVPASTLARQSHDLKLRERASYEFALVSAAVALDLDCTEIRAARVALGGVAPKPWRLGDAEVAMRGASLEDEPSLRRVLEASFAEARPRRHNGFKFELAKRAVIRALQNAGGTA